MRAAADQQGTDEAVSLIFPVGFSPSQVFFAFSVINKKPFPVLFFENVEQPRKSIPRRRSRVQRPAAVLFVWGGRSKRRSKSAVVSFG